ncbi:MAG: type II toxin-antitoxin system HicB family antitoxin [Deltaproteobacteria bacterium]|nr:type II toxin-antitoxin system HicB family antitoxin [Deltaproteobacteria bacterium]
MLEEPAAQTERVREGGVLMRTFTAAIERCARTICRLCSRFSGCHTQGENLDELNKNLKEVIVMLLYLERP